MSSPSSELNKLKRELARKNLERLAQFEPPKAPVDGPGSGDNHCNIALDVLLDWSKRNSKSITKSISQQAFLNKRDLDYAVAFLPFMESTAVYLRDLGKHQKAWKLFHDAVNNHEDGSDLKEHAIDTYLSAFEKIEELANSWNMDFIPICDLIHKSPKGSSHLDGPYCGVFVTTKAQENAPFIGLAFKGTNPSNLREDLVDYNYQLYTQSTYLGGNPVSFGVFTGLFGDFGLPDKTPYAAILEAVDRTAEIIPGAQPRTHVTGHSLGGSYSSFAYAQLLSDFPKLPSPFFTMGDEYNFGAPRVGSQDWAKYNNLLMSEGHGISYRIVNDQDIVPQVPPTDLKKDQLDFYHIDQGYRIYKNKAPTTIPTEVGGQPPQPYPIPSGNVKDLITAVMESIYHCESLELT